MNHQAAHDRQADKTAHQHHVNMMDSRKDWRDILPVIIHVVLDEFKFRDGAPVERRHLIIAGLYHWHLRECLEELEDAVESRCIHSVGHDLN